MSVIGDLSVPLTAVLPLRTIQKIFIIMDVITLHWPELPFIPIKSYSGTEPRLEGAFFFFIINIEDVQNAVATIETFVEIGDDTL